MTLNRCLIFTHSSDPDKHQTVTIPEDSIILGVSAGEWYNSTGGFSGEGEVQLEVFLVYVHNHGMMVDRTIHVHEDGEVIPTCCGKYIGTITESNIKYKGTPYNPAGPLSIDSEHLKMNPFSNMYHFFECRGDH